MLSLDGAEAANTGSDENTHAVGMVFFYQETRIFHRKLGCRQRVLDKGVHLLDVLFGDEA